MKPNLMGFLAAALLLAGCPDSTAVGTSGSTGSPTAGSTGTATNGTGTGSSGTTADPTADGMPCTYTTSFCDCSPDFCDPDACNSCCDDVTNTGFYCHGECSSSSSCTPTTATSGSSGTNGTAGTSGTTSGTSGTTSGTSGTTSGTSGTTSGTSGTSGVPSSWSCNPTYYGQAGGPCDCGCGAPDPDCNGQGCTTPDCTAPACSYCHDGNGNSISCSTSGSNGGTSGTSGTSGTCATGEVYCPARGGAPAMCWDAGTDCNSVTDCGGQATACSGIGFTVNCVRDVCDCENPSYPVQCGAQGSVPAACWSPDTACSTVTDCGSGSYHACTDSSLTYDCGSGTCQ